MSEVDTIFYIKQVYSHLSILRPWLEAKEIYDPKKLRGALAPSGFYQSGKNGMVLDKILEESFAKAEDSKFVGRMQPYQDHERLLIAHLAKGGFDGKIPIFVEGSSPAGLGKKEKDGLDPFSNSNLFTTMLIAHAYEQYEQDFLDRFRVVFAQPVTYTTTFHENKFGLQGIREVLADELADPQLRWRGSLEKYDSMQPKIGCSRFTPDLFALDRIKDDFADPDAVSFSRAGATSLQEFIDYKKCEIYLNSQLEALKFSQLLDMIAGQAKKNREEFSLDGVSLYMGKTSWCADALTTASEKYCKEYVPVRFVGGDYGIHADNDLPHFGICEPMAIARLFGLYHSLNQQVNAQEPGFEPDSRASFRKIKGQKKPRHMRYVSRSPHPEFLLEQGTENATNTMHNVVDAILKPREIELVKQFAYNNRVGFCAIQPRIVTLLTEDRSIYTDLRKQNKTNTRWLAELYGKEILFPSQIPGLFAEFGAVALPQDITGFEFSSPTSLSIDERTLDMANSGKFTFTGCSIERLLSGVHAKSATILLEQELALCDEETKKEYWKHQTRDHKSIAGLRSAAIHRVTLFNDATLAHNQTLAIAGLEPVSTHNYTRIPLLVDIARNNQQYMFRGHPDATLLFRRGTDEYDVMIIETEITRSSAYPHHRRNLKGFFHGYAIKQALATQGKSIVNIYVVQNTLQFYRGFYGDVVEPLPHSQFRSQQHTPITKFGPSSIMHPLMDGLTDAMSREKREIASHEHVFIDEKKRQFVEGNCDNCFLSKKLLCDALKRRITNKLPIKPLLNRASLQQMGEKYTTTLESKIGFGVERDLSSDMEADGLRITEIESTATELFDDNQGLPG